MLCWSCQLPLGACGDGASLEDADEPIHGEGLAQENAVSQPAGRGRLHSRGINSWFVGPDEAEGGANLPAIDLARELDGAVETIEVGGCDQIEGVLAGGGQNGLIAGLSEREGNQRAKFGIVLDDENRGAGRLRRSGIQDWILQLRSRSWAQGQEKESDIANGYPLAASMVARLRHSIDVGDADGREDEYRMDYRLQYDSGLGVIAFLSPDRASLDECTQEMD